MPVVGPGRSTARFLVALAFLLAVAAPDLWRAAREAIHPVALIPIRYRSTLSDALAEAKRAGKPVFVELGASWCAPCRDMQTGTYRDPRVAGTLNDRFVPVLIDIDQDRATTARFRVGPIPDAVFLAPDGDVLTRVTGEVDAATFLRAADEARRRLAEHKSGGGSRGTLDAPPLLPPPDFPLP